MERIGVQKPTEHSSDIPALWLRFVYRVAQLQRGQAYALTIFVPEDKGSEPVWAIKPIGKIENQR